MARREVSEPEITPAAPEDVLGTEPTPGSDATDVDTIGEPDDANEDAAKEEDKEPFLSEGVRQDLLTFGQATDPATGGVFKRDEDSGSVTFTPKRRNRPALEVEEPESRPVTVKTDTI
jgi:hypothetical protein